MAFLCSNSRVKTPFGNLICHHFLCAMIFFILCDGGGQKCVQFHAGEVKCFGNLMAMQVATPTVEMISEMTVSNLDDFRKALKTTITNLRTVKKERLCQHLVDTWDFFNRKAIALSITDGLREIDRGAYDGKLVIFLSNNPEYVPRMVKCGEIIHEQELRTVTATPLVSGMVETMTVQEINRFIETFDGNSWGAKSQDCS